MSNIRTETHQAYSPRAYPKEAPEVAEARRAGFEAGRQYEASLRQDDPATVINASEFAKLDPYTLNETGEYLNCFFCGKHNQEVPAHHRDCLWVRCGGVTLA